MSNTKKYCDGLDCAICDEKEPCIYKIANELEEKLLAKEQECKELKQRLSCNCFDTKSNNNRCISYNRMAEDYERDLKQLDQLKVENERLKKLLKEFIKELKECLKKK